MGLWWDDNSKEERTRTLWTWANEGKKRDNRLFAGLSKKEEQEEREKWTTPVHRLWLADRGREQAERLAEGVPQAEDQVHYGTGPFGKITTNADTLRHYKRTRPSWFESMSRMLEKRWIQTMKKEDR